MRRTKPDLPCAPSFLSPSFRLSLRVGAALCGADDANAQCGNRRRDGASCQCAGAVERRCFALGRHRAKPRRTFPRGGPGRRSPHRFHGRHRRRSSSTPSRSRTLRCTTSPRWCCRRASPMKTCSACRSLGGCGGSNMLTASWCWNNSSASFRNHSLGRSFRLCRPA